MALRTRFGDRCGFAGCFEAATSEAGSTTHTGMMRLEPLHPDVLKKSYMEFLPMPEVTELNLGLFPKP